jgi:hypothetical protein
MPATAKRSASTATKKAATKTTTARKRAPLKAVPSPEQKAEEKAKLSKASRRYVRTNTNTKVGRAETILVTPELATYWLTMRREPNRKISEVDVDGIIDSVINNRFIYNGEAMKFIGYPSEDGDNAEVDFFDGGHRARAIQKSGIALELDVVFGLPPAAKDTVDIGRKRTARDVLEMSGHANASLVSGIARIILTYDKEAPQGVRPGRNITSLAVRDLVNQHPNRFQEAARIAYRYYKKEKARPGVPPKRGLQPVPPSTIGYCYLKFVDKGGRDTATLFLETWLGVVRHEIGESEAGSAIVALANRFQTAKENRERIDRPSQISLIFRAWNGWRRGEDLEKLPTRSRSGVVPIPALR